MATKKTNNKKVSKKTAVAKKSSGDSKKTKKQEDLSAKVKKSVSKKATKSKIVKKNRVKKTSNSEKTKGNNKNSKTIKKIEQIKTDRNMENKPERESIKLLREAIKAKSKNISKPAAVKKHLIVKENNNDNLENDNKTASSSILNKSEAENIKSADFVFSRFEKKEENLNNNDSNNKETITGKLEEKKSETQTFSKNTYGKSDIFKKPVAIKSSTEDEELKKNIEDSTFNQSEIDDAIENAAIIDEDTPIEDYSVYSSKKLEELKRKDIKIIETEDEMKSSGIPQIERKPAEPYAVPPHSSIKKEKKSNKFVAIIGIIIIILGLSYLGFQFFGNKSNDLEDDFYNIATNETEIYTNEAEQDFTNTFITNDSAAIEQTNTASEINDIKEVPTDNISNNTSVQDDTNIAPASPNLPNPPVIPNPPSNPPAQNQNTSSYLGGSVYRTKWTDTLSSIASSELGDSRRWPAIYVMNENIFEDPDSLVFNKDIRIPEGAKKKVEDMTAEEKRALYNDYIRVSQIYLNIGKTNSANALRNRADSIVR